MQKSRMQAIGAGVTTLALAFSLASCSGEAPQPGTEPTGTEPGTLDVMMSPHSLTD